MPRAQPPALRAPFLISRGALLVLVACGGSTPPPSPPAPEPAPAPASPAPTAAAAADAAPPEAVASAAPQVDASAPASAATTTESDTSTADVAGVAYLDAVGALFKERKGALTDACWMHSKSSEHAYAGKAVVRVGPAGKILSVKVEGTDDAASACIDKAIKKWKFPPPNGTATVNQPIRLRREVVPGKP